MQSDACINFAERLLYRYNQFCNMKQSKAEKFVYLCRQQKLKHMNYPLNYYASRNPLNTIIAENMVDLTMLEEEDSSFEYKACLCFSNAYLICQKMIKESPIQLWSFPDYCSKANYGSQDKDFNKIIKAVTLTIVYILTDHFDEKWKSENQKILKKIKDYILKLYVSGETFNLPGGPEIIKPFASKTVCATVFDNLRRGTDIDYVIPFDDILYLGTRIVDNNHLESDKYITRDEVEKIISQHFKNINEQKKEEIDEEEERTNEDILKAWEQAMVNAKAEIESKIPSFEYDKKNEGLKIITGSDNHNNGKNESLEEIIKTTVKKYLDEETEVSDAVIDEIIADVYGKDLVDKVNRELAAANNVEENNEQTNQLPISNTDDSLRQQLTYAQKTIEEQAQTIDELRAEIARQNEAKDSTKSVEQISHELQRLQTKNEELTLAVQSYKDQGKGLTAPEAAILITAICLEMNQIPANGREGLAPIIEFCWGKSSSTSSEALRRKVTEESAEKLACNFDLLTPKLARIIRELSQKLEERNNERLKQINPNVNK